MDSSAFSFSPLFIGEVSSTIPRLTIKAVVANLSVPSSLGKSLQHHRCVAFVRICFPFSPLFIGEVSSTIRRSSRATTRGDSFSPLFIGEVSSTLLSSSTAEATVTLSVPSSLGKSLQRSPKVRSRSRLMSFSPLFIGEVSSTELFLFGQRFRPPFSPLFIGEVSSTVSLYSLESSVQSFSPLFIGEVSSTVWRQHEVYAHRPFQSPLHWGSLFNVFS